jgi:hypothetical protein
MQTRYRAAATALLLTATAGMAATGGAAQASGSHHAGAGASKSLTITLKSTASGVTVSDSKFRPGNTIFKVKNMDGKTSKGLIQVLRLKPGYDIGQAGADFGQAFSGGTDQATIDAINRIYDNVVFYGGMEAKGDTSTVAKWAVKIDKPGTYLVLNFDAGTPPSTFTVAGDAQKRAMPAASGVIDTVVGPHGVGNQFAPGKNIATSGWMSTTNSAEEPHFVDLQQVKKGTTNADITAFFQGGPDPTVRGGGSAGTGVISPGHSFRWSYKLPQGRYVALCFMPSKTDGMPHAIMGMHKVFNLG